MTGPWATVGRLVGAVLGLVLLLGGIGAVVFVDWNPTPPPPAQIVRPVKTAEVVDTQARPERRFRGTVLAGRTVDLSFQVGGRLMEADLALGRRVEAGAVLARLDPVPFEQQIATLRPQLEQKQLTLDRVKRLVQSNAGTPQELANAQAARDAAQAQLEIAQRALEDSVLRAPFDALIVQRSVENFQNVTPGTPALRLQDITSLDVAVDLPESVVARSQPSVEPVTLAVEFPVRPGRSYPATVKEASAQADPQTGLYRVVFTVSPPDDLTVLPGMAARVIFPARQGKAGGEVAAPLAAVFVDAQGGKNVWRLSGGGPEYTVERVTVEVARVAGDAAVIARGLKPGDRVVTAGTAFLEQGQRVTVVEARR